MNSELTALLRDSIAAIRAANDNLTAISLALLNHADTSTSGSSVASTTRGLSPTPTPAEQQVQHSVEAHDETVSNNASAPVYTDKRTAVPQSGGLDDNDTAAEEPAVSVPSGSLHNEEHPSSVLPVPRGEETGTDESPGSTSVQQSVITDEGSAQSPETVGTDDASTTELSLIEKDLGSLSLLELREMAKDMSLRITGTKPVLRTRITEARKISRGEASNLPPEDVDLTGDLDPFSTGSDEPDAPEPPTPEAPEALSIAPPMSLKL